MPATATTLPPQVSPPAFALSGLPPHELGGIAVSAIVQLAVITLPFLAPFFRVSTAGFSWHWGMIAGLSAAPVVVLELAKYVRQRGERSAALRQA